MIPFRFGSARRQMYGVYHPSEDRSSSTGVLLCNPLGQEAIRTHRIYRVLAERLAGAGLNVLRFDYYGTGDSSGSDEEGELEGWCADVQTAHAELLQRAHCARTAWIGARIGGTVALLGTRGVTDPPVRVVLWEPVVGGRNYLREIGLPEPTILGQAADQPAIHAVVGIAQGGRTTPSPAIDRSAVDRPAPDGGSGAEALGFLLGWPLVRQLAALSADAFIDLRLRNVVVISRPRIPGMNELADRLRSAGADAKFVSFEHSFDWVSDEALNTAIVPNEAIQLLTAHLEAID